MKVLFLDRSTGLETVNDLRTKPRGGMINSLFKVSDYLAIQGHEVDILSDIENFGRTEAGVTWGRSLTTSDYDVLICNRGIGDAYPEINAKKRILWTHDLPHNGFIPDPKNMGAFDHTVFMSKYAEKIWRTFYRTIGKSVYIPNGVDKENFYPREKDLNTLIYFSHPNRGLNKLPLIADSIQAQIGNQRTISVKAYCNPEKMYPNEGDMGDHTDSYQLDYPDSDVLEIFDPIPTEHLAREVGEAGLCIMPTGYPEICSNNILQCLASGTPVITTGNLGATPQWIKHKKNGMLTNYQPADYMIHSVEMVRNAVEVLENEKLHRKLIRKAYKSKVLTWEQVGKKWEKLIKS